MRRSKTNEKKWRVNLEQLIDQVRELADDKCIFARKPWSATSEADISRLGTDFRVPTSISALGLEYFLEVPLAKEVLEVFGDKPASKQEELNLLIFYAENDAYPEWVYER